MNAITVRNLLAYSGHTRGVQKTRRNAVVHTLKPVKPNRNRQTMRFLHMGSLAVIK